MKTRFVLYPLLAAALTLGAGCSSLPSAKSLKFWDRGIEGGLPYRASLKADRSGDLTVTVQAQGASVAAARESARFPVTAHCIKEQGRSDADWVTDPATGDWAAVRNERGDLTFRARCRA